MRFMTLFMPNELGINSFAYLQMTVSTNHIEQVANELNSKPWLPQLFLCTGQFNLKGALLAESLDQIMNVRIQEIRNLPGVLQAEISPLSQAYKYEMGWGQPFTEPFIAQRLKSGLQSV